WDFDDGTTAVTATSTINHNFTEDRNYNVSVVVISQNDRKDTATVTVYPGNIPPTAVIKQPSPAMSYPDDGSPKTIYYLGEVADEDGPTPEARWRVALRHNDHRHELAETIGLDGEFTVRHEEENTFYL